MLALPFITEGTEFDGCIYATEPTLQIGRYFNCLLHHKVAFLSSVFHIRLYMEELVHYLENSPKSKRTSRWKKIVECLPAPLSSALRPEDWKEIYSQKGINAALAKVRMVGFNEKIVRPFIVLVNSL